MKKIAAILTLTTALLCAQTIHVKYRSTPVDIDNGKFKCVTTDSSFVRATCYDQRDRYMVILLRNTWYHYCDMPKVVWEELIEAESVGRFYNRNIRGNWSCRTGYVPE